MSGWRTIKAVCRYCGEPVEHFGDICEACTDGEES